MSDQLGKLKVALSDRYTIERELGARGLTARRDRYHRSALISANQLNLRPTLESPALPH